MHHTQDSRCFQVCTLKSKYMHIDIYSIITLLEVSHISLKSHLITEIANALTPTRLFSLINNFLLY